MDRATNECDSWLHHPQWLPMFPRKSPNSIVRLSRHPGSLPSPNMPWAQPRGLLPQHSLGLQMLLLSHLPCKDCPISARLWWPSDVPVTVALGGECAPVEGVAETEKMSLTGVGKEIRVQAGVRGAQPLCPLPASLFPTCPHSPALALRNPWSLQNALFAEKPEVAQKEGTRPHIQDREGTWRVG